jgi:hypothetical protein
MKKIIAFLLIVNMILCMQCFTVAAKEDLVGTVNSSSAFGDYRDGATSPNGSGSYEVYFLMKGETAPRYAVDVVAEGLEFQFDTDLVWDVNTLDYVAPSAAGEVGAPDVIPTFTVANRSNMPVKITLTDTETAAANAAGISLNFLKASVTLRATAPKSVDPVSEVFTGSWACVNNDWPAAYGVLKDAAGAESKVVIATVTFTVSAPTP